jgi:tRNA (guanine-N7-)-methyltransferase
MRQNDGVPGAASAVEFVPANYFRPIAPAEMFPRTAAIEVDLGCGDGAYLTALAGQNRDRNFLGIERLRGRVHSACHKIQQAELGNARILCVEITYAVAHLLPPRSIAAFHLMFPDPWPKRRHLHRRLVTVDFLASIHRALVPGGTLQIATDQSDYFRQIESVAAQSPQLTPISAQDPPVALSTFERRFCQSTIYRLGLRNVSDVT